MRRAQSFVATAAASVLLFTFSGCGPDTNPSAPPDRLASTHRPSLDLIYGTVCAVAHDEVVQFQLLQNACPAAEGGGFDRDEWATFQYQYAPANNSSGDENILATFEYRFLAPDPVTGEPRYGARLIDVVDVPQFGAPVATGALNVHYIRELAQLKIVGYLSSCTPAQSSPWECWQSNTGTIRHMEPRICVDNPGTSPPWTADDDCASGPEGTSEGHNLLPTAGFTVAQGQTGVAGVQCSVMTFDASGSSSDPDGNGSTLTAIWEFGDGQGDSGLVVSHAYCTQGTYPVRLRVEDPQGGTDVYTLSVTPVFDQSDPVHGDICGESVAAYQTVYSWTACLVMAPAGTTFTWYRTDESGSFQQVGSGTSYTASSGASDFSLQLVLRAPSGQSHTSTLSVDVLPPPPTPPSVSISGPSKVRANYTCRWEAVVSGGTPPYQYRWFRGAALVSTDYEYIGPTGPTGTFYLQVEVTDSRSATASALLQVRSSTLTTTRCFI